jgi:hypothetical protein
MLKRASIVFYAIIIDGIAVQAAGTVVPNSRAQASRRDVGKFYVT